MREARAVGRVKIGFCGKISISHGMKEAPFKSSGRSRGQLSKMRQQIASQPHLEANRVRLSLK
jgi:hypothetical protein